MTLRIRQIVLAARNLEPVVDDLREVFGVGVSYRDPLVAEFGLHNAVMPVGDQFIEVVSPTQAGTPAGRLLERRGDSGYMLLLQTDDLDRERARLDGLGVRVVWSSNYDDIRAIHLHPKDVGGAIVSLDQPTPPASWRWAGPDWQSYVSADGAQNVREVEIEAADPQTMARRWAQVLGIPEPAARAKAWQLPIVDGTLRFVQADRRGDGISAFTISLSSPPAALAKARSRNLPVSDTTVTLGGTRFHLIAA